MHTLLVTLPFILLMACATQETMEEQGHEKESRMLNESLLLGPRELAALRDACKHNNDACIRLFDHYYLKGDTVTALKYLKTASLRGYLPANELLGFILIQDERTAEEGRKILEAAKSKGSAVAIEHLEYEKILRKNLTRQQPPAQPNPFE